MKLGGSLDKESHDLAALLYQKSGIHGL